MVVVVVVAVVLVKVSVIEQGEGAKEIGSGYKEGRGGVLYIVVNRQKLSHHTNTQHQQG